MEFYFFEPRIRDLQPSRSRRVIGWNWRWRRWGVAADVVEREAVAAPDEVAAVGEDASVDGEGVVVVVGFERVAAGVAEMVVVGGGRLDVVGNAVVAEGVGRDAGLDVEYLPPVANGRW